MGVFIFNIRVKHITLAVQLHEYSHCVTPSEHSNLSSGIYSLRRLGIPSLKVASGMPKVRSLSKTIAYGFEFAKLLWCHSLQDRSHYLCWFRRNGPIQRYFTMYCIFISSNNRFPAAGARESIFYWQSKEKRKPWREIVWLLYERDHSWAGRR